MIDKKVLEYSRELNNFGIEHEIVEHPELREVREVQDHLGLTLADGFSTLILKSNDKYFALIRRDDSRVDFAKLQRELGVENLRMASTGEFESLTGLPVGAAHVINPVVATFLDELLFEKDYLIGGSGSFTASVKYKAEDLKKIPNSRVVNVSDKGKKRILTGDTPTGKLHIGHYVGTLENRVKLQNEYETFIILADMHSFATLSEYPEKVRQATIDVALDNLAVGLDPKKIHMFIESEIPEIYELAVIYSMLVSHARALRNPTIKDEIVMKGLGDNFSLGFVNYPMFQAADITCVGAQLVPVGKDQLPHIEQTREIVEKFNALYGEVLVKPEGLVGKVGKLVGTDGNPKMGKSLGNTIMLSETTESLRKIVMNMYTDPKRIHPTDPGTVEGNPVFIYHDAFNPNKEEVEDLKARYRVGKVGDVEVKEKLFQVLDKFLEPFRERRGYYEAHMDEVMEILAEGTRITRMETQKTLGRVREAMKMNYSL